MAGRKTSRKKIVITAGDRTRLEALLASDFTRSMGDKQYLNDLRGELEIATVVEADKIPPDVVTMNSTVRLREIDSDDVETYTLVYPKDANIAENKLSVLAPIGTAILGYRVGDIVDWHVPSGRVRVRIEEVTFQPERDGALA